MSPKRNDTLHHQVAPEIALLIRILDESFERKAWHGPNLKGSIRGLAPDRAVWRPQPGRHSIAEHVIHAAHWKYAVRRRIEGGTRGAFPLKGSNRFAVPDSLSQAEWRSHVVASQPTGEALSPVSSRLTSQSLSAAAASCAAAEASTGFCLAKYLPVMPSTSGELAR